MPNALFLSRNTIKSQAYSLYRKLGASIRNQAVTRSVNWDSWRADHPLGGSMIRSECGRVVRASLAGVNYRT
jgi:hypothetical protein